MTTPNPLLDFSDLPRFDTVQPEHVKPAIESLLTAGRELIERLTADSTPATWQDFAGALSDGLEPFGRAWGIVGHLHSVNDVPAWREAYNEMLPEVSRFYAELGQNLKLFAKYKALRESAEYATLSTEQQKDRRQRSARFPPQRCRTAGRPEAALPGDYGRTLQPLGQVLGKPARRHQRLCRVVTDEAELAGLPDDAKAAARSRRKRRSPGWKFTLHMPSYGPVMQYADNRELRARMYRAYATRAAEFGTSKPELDNTPVIRTACSNCAAKKRKCSATTITPRFRWCPRWPTVRAQVLAFLRELAAKAKPFAAKDIAELRAFAKDELGLEDFQPWDVGLRFRETAAGALRLLRTGSEAILHRTQGARRTVQGHRNLFNVQASKRTRRRSGTRTSASSVSKRRPANWSASSTSTSTPAKPSAAAPGWTKPARAGVPSAASRSRSPTSTATSPARSAANRPPSPTTT
jgi:oligopeptidase A